MGEVTGDGQGSGPGARAMISIKRLVISIGMIGLWLELGSIYDGRMSTRLRFRVKVCLGDVDGEGEGTVSGSRAMVMVRGSVRCMWKIRLW